MELETVQKDFNEALSHIKSMVEDKTKNVALASDVVKKDEFDKVSKSFIDAGDKIQKQEQEIAALKASIQHLNQGTADKTDSIEKEHKEAFTSFVRKGDNRALETLLEEKSTQMGAFTGEGGGYTVPALMSAQVIKRVFETSPIRSIASVDTISSDAVTYLLDDEEPAASWVGETGSRNTATDSADFGKRTIAVHDQAATAKITQRLLDDSAFNIEAWAAEKTASKFARAENTAFVTGAGTSSPRGFTTYTAGSATYNRDQIEQINCGASGALTGAGLIDLQGGLKSEYDAGAVWVMKRSTYTAVLNLMYTDNKFDALNRSGVQGERLRLLDKPVILADDMPAVANDALCVAYGNFQTAYKIVDRLGISLVRDPYTATPFVLFKFNKRVGGDVLNTEAIKIGKTPS